AGAAPDARRNTRPPKQCPSAALRRIAERFDSVMSLPPGWSGRRTPSAVPDRDGCEGCDACCRHVDVRDAALNERPGIADADASNRCAPTLAQNARCSVLFVARQPARKHPAVARKRRLVVPPAHARIGIGLHCLTADVLASCHAAAQATAHPVARARKRWQTPVITYNSTRQPGRQAPDRRSRQYSKELQVPDNPGLSRAGIPRFRLYGE